MMVTTLDKTHRDAIATQLADMIALQRLIVTNEQKLIVDCSEDAEIESCIDNMLTDDRKSVKVIEEVAAKFGELSSPQDQTQKLIHKVEAMMAKHHLALYEKIMQHEGLKHRSVMSGLLVYKMAQALGDEVKSAIEPLNAIGFRNRAHQEQLKSVILILGTRELVGKDPEQNLWTQAKDAIAALKGTIGGFSD